MDFKGKVAVITGAGSGIGKGLAKALAAAGCNLVLAGPHQDKLEATAWDLGDHYKDAIKGLCVETDVSKLEDVQALADHTTGRFGQVDLLFNNAGVALPGAIGEISMAEWEWTLGVNLWGPIYGVQVFLPVMERQCFGHICTTASESGLYGTPFLGAYNVSKFGVVGLMTSLARDLRTRSSPVGASLFCPSATATALTSTARDNAPEDAAIERKAEATQQFWDMVSGVVAEGMDPKAAAAVVLQGIQQGRFWLFSHPHVPETALRQAEAMAADGSLIDL